MDKWSFHDMGLFSNAHCNSFNVGKGNATTFSWVCASGVESREQSSSPYTLTRWVDLGTLLAFCGSLWASFYSFSYEMGKILAQSNLCCCCSQIRLSDDSIIYMTITNGTSITQGLTVITAPLWGFSGGSAVKNPPAMLETWVQSLGQEDPLEESMATHSSNFVWKIP